MGTIPDQPKIKRVLVLIELEGGAIGAAYSDQLRDDASVDVKMMETEIRPLWDDSKRIPPEPRYRISLGEMVGLVVHEPGFHGPVVESMVQAVMDQWKMGQ